jgi:hypothetical protein
MTEMQLNILPMGQDDCCIRAITKSKDIVLPTLGIRTFPHHYEIVVVDLAGEISNLIVIRQNGNVEVNP